VNGNNTLEEEIRERIVIGNKIWCPGNPNESYVVQ
jgi:hypothetical protein